MGAELSILFFLLWCLNVVFVVPGCASFGVVLAALRWGCAMHVLRRGYTNARPMPAVLKEAAGLTEDPEVAELCEGRHALGR